MIEAELIGGPANGRIIKATGTPVIEVPTLRAGTFGTTKYRRGPLEHDLDGGCVPTRPVAYIEERLRRITHPPTLFGLPVEIDASLRSGEIGVRSNA